MPREARKAGCKDLDPGERKLIEGLRAADLPYQHTGTRHIEQSTHRRYYKISTATGRSVSCIGRFVRSETYQEEHKKGRKRCSTEAQDTEFVQTYLHERQQAHVEKRPREGLVEEARVKCEFPGSYHTGLRRTKSDKLNDCYRRCHPRETPLDTANDQPNRLHWAEWYLDKDESYWEEDVIFVDCKRFSILLSAYQKYPHTPGPQDPTNLNFAFQ